jgi:hypothetical protein
MVDVTYVEVIHNRVVRLRLSEGSDRVVDLAPLFWGFVFERIAEDDDCSASKCGIPRSAPSSGQMGPTSSPTFGTASSSPPNQLLPSRRRKSHLFA